MEVQSPDLLGFINPEVHPFRRFFAKFLLAVPALTTLAVTVQTQASVNNYKPQAADKELNARINSYVPLIRMMAGDRNPDDVTFNVDQARKYGIAWVKRQEQGHLKPLFINQYSDSIMEGATGQIIRSNLNLSKKLSDSAAKSLHARRWVDAAEDALLSVQVANIIKNSDPLTTSLSNVRTRQAMITLRAAAPYLDRESKTEAAKVLIQLGSDRQEMKELMQRSFDLYIREHPLGAKNRNLTAAQVESLRSRDDLPTKQSFEAIVGPLDTSVKRVGRPYYSDPFLSLAAGVVVTELETRADTARTLEALGN